MRCRTRDTRALGRRCSPSRITVSAATAGSALSVLCLRLVPRLSLTTHCTVSRRFVYVAQATKGTMRSKSRPKSKNFFFLLSYAEKKSKNCAFDSLCYIWGGCEKNILCDQPALKLAPYPQPTTFPQDSPDCKCAFQSTPEKFFFTSFKYLHDLGTDTSSLGLRRCKTSP